MRSQNLAKSQIQMLPCSWPSHTHLERFVPSVLTVLRPRLLRASQVIPTIILFYNAPQPPSGIFDAFLRIPNQQQDIHTRSYADFVKIQAFQTTSPAGLR